MTFRKESKSLTVIMILDKLPPLGVGGAETQALRLSKRLIQIGVNVIFLTPGRDKIKGYGEVEGMPVYRLHSFFNYAWDILSALKKKTVVEPVVQIEYDDATQRTNEVTTPIVIGVKLRYLIFYFNCFFFLLRRRNKFDIIHVHSMEWPSFVGAWLTKFFNKRLIIKDATMNGINGLARYPGGKEKLKAVINEAHFVAMTKAIHNNYLSFGVPENKIIDIPNGIEITEQHKNRYADKNRKVIFVGNLSQQPAKGIDILLKAWKKVIQNYPDAKLSVVGDGPLAVYNDYLVQNNIHKSVTLLGKREDVKNLLMESDIFVLPSRREGMPNALMEAMLLGLPCIGTDISGCQDLIADRINGILVPPANIEKLLEALVYLMENAEAGKRMGTLARETICTFNSMEIVSKQYLSLYFDLLNVRTVNT
jgi:glycosyltransferase involved in cell wall biosynthesis